MPNKLAKNDDSSIQYKQFFDGDLCALLTAVNRWLKKTMKFTFGKLPLIGQGGIPPIGRQRSIILQWRMKDDFANVCFMPKLRQG